MLTLTTWSLYPITWLIEETKVIDSSDADIMHSVFAGMLAEGGEERGRAGREEEREEERGGERRGRGSFTYYIYSFRQSVIRICTSLLPRTPGGWCSRLRHPRHPLPPQSFHRPPALSLLPLLLFPLHTIPLSRDHLLLRGNVSRHHHAAHPHQSIRAEIRPRQNRDLRLHRELR